MGILWYSYAKEVLFMDTKDVLYNLRAKKGLSQDELARACGVSRQTVNAIENNKYDPTLALAFRLAQVLGTTVDLLFTPSV